MKVSVALCTYNGAPYLLEQLTSIAAQTRLPDELIVCDDGSTDNTLELLYSFREACPFPVQVHENESNLGSTKNFEKAVQLCTGDVIALSDQDDVWKPGKLEKIISAFKKDPSVGYVFSNAELVDERLAPLGRTLWESVRFQGNIYKRFVKGEQFLCLLKQHIVTGATLAFKASLREFVVPFPADAIWIHDAWIALIASSIKAPGVALSESLILYRQHPRQQLGTRVKTRADKLRELYEGIIKVKERLLRIIEKDMRSYTLLKDRLIAIEQRYGINVTGELRYIEEITTHFTNRLLINSTSGPRKVKLIWEESKSGRYARFANSWASAARDLVL